MDLQWILKSWKVKYKPYITVLDVVYWRVLTWKETLILEHILETETQFIRELPHFLYIVITWGSECVLRFIITAHAVFMTLASLFSAGMLQGYPKWSHVHCMYYQGYFLHMTTLIWPALIRNKHQQGNSARYYKLYKWRWLQTISGTEDVWQERICEKFRQPIIRRNLDYVFMQICDIGFKMCILQFYIFCHDICLLLIY
jgi:hypothetical protein